MNQKEESLKIIPKLGFEKFNNQNLEFRENLKTSMKPRFKRRFQNTKRKIFKIRKKWCYKRFLHKNNFFQKSVKKKMKDPLKINTLTNT